MKSKERDAFSPVADVNVEESLFSFIQSFLTQIYNFLSFISTLF